ncbi:type IV pilin protein [Alcanivorax sediminis]|uniref:Prepilin-type N-terminal cleavage/methylation domain-containing protein n=1 Tax=Alcanivorax sediminis TaxID=2663008 RepID=A0A6N7M2W7_9GAMM|nr:type IV pilin protein [Alcanivorax sediminis]MQX54831.1 prepilin-type N-terminal cleavage/methylation domain-containing protein [Alcanivorax sediminis]
MTTGKQPNRGFTLIELMIVIAVISILAAIAFPSYQSHVQKTRQTEMKGLLSGFATALENYRAQNFSYEDAGTALTPPTNLYYTVTLNVDADFRGYTLLATPKAGQTGTGAMAINETGQNCLLKTNDTSCTPGTDPSWN